MYQNVDALQGLFSCWWSSESMEVFELKDVTKTYSKKDHLTALQCRLILNLEFNIYVMFFGSFR